uniref:Protein kinase domain-containing protein n=1 Tax=Tetraselmis chuii TaxID=63592 RepID=A0A7S1X2E9_9CHLO|mmetsp:Transcript_23663/g.42052  ORF Transcript_23663/g.42052 Transcript_23663/m.42052 type:complete len:285 (+) Transcript_23663:3-857(+)
MGRPMGESCSARDALLSPTPSTSSAYDFGDVLGSGSFSIVRSVIHRSTGVQLAIKCFTDNFSLASAEREISCLRLCQHPSIVTFYDSFEEDGHMYMVTEQIPGRDMQVCLSERGSYSEEDVRVVMKTLLAALVSVHRVGVCHRDIKLENIVLGEKDDLASLRLIDFGLAARLTKETPYLAIPCGTPAYAAPEVVRRSPRYGTSCDIWSAGVIAYLLLCGEPPFSSSTGLRELIEKVRAADYSMCDPAWELVSDDAKDFVASLLTLDPSRRPTASKALEHAWLSS